MREILFRGKSLVTHEWVQGDLFQHGDQRFIMADNRNTEVVPETVGQFTGLTDKNGVRIFEGDIVKEYCTSPLGDPLGDIGIIKWDSEECMLYRTSDRFNDDKLVTVNCIYEVIGNIHDDTEMLGGSE